MSEFKLQRFRGGWAACLYEDGRRVSRRALRARDAAGAQVEFDRIVGAVRTPDDPTVRDLWDAYRADREGRVVAANMEHSGKAVLPFFGAMKPRDIKAAKCRAYVAARRKTGRQDGTIRTELGHLRIALAWAEKTGLIAKAPAIEKPPAAPPKERYLTRDEFARVLAAAEFPHVKLFLLLGVSTAGRLRALLDLTWAQVDFDRGLVYLGTVGRLRPMKGRATVPMTDTLREALREAHAFARTPHVIEWAGRPVRAVRKGVETAAARAGVADVTPHVLRHTAAVWMAEDGRSMDEIARVLGHSDSRITERVYAQFSPTYLRRAVSSLEVRK